MRRIDSVKAVLCRWRSKATRLLFLRVAQGAASRLLGPETALAAVEELESEHANLLAALAWAAENEPESALKLSNALGWFWEFRGYLAQGREWFKKTIAQSPATLVDLLRGEAMSGQRRLACWQGDYRTRRRPHRTRPASV